jgi:uncharacterized membrane protein YhaH (DUF805 family)
MVRGTINGRLRKDAEMTFMIYYAIGWLVGLIALAVTRTRDVRSAARVLLLWQLVVTVGLSGFLGGFGHLFMGNQIARSIGWAPGSGFQTELGYACLGMGLLGVGSYWFRDHFWLATVLFVTAFLVGSALVHVRDLWLAGDFRPGNAVTILPDLIGPLTLFVLWFIAAERRPAVVRAEA